jgi:hypothetical protein
MKVIETLNNLLRKLFCQGNPTVPAPSKIDRISDRNENSFLGKELDELHKKWGHKWDEWVPEPAKVDRLADREAFEDPLGTDKKSKYGKRNGERDTNSE